VKRLALSFAALKVVVSLMLAAPKARNTWTCGTIERFKGGCC
jgi:hypothetical protein